MAIPGIAPIPPGLGALNGLSLQPSLPTLGNVGSAGAPQAAGQSFGQMIAGQIAQIDQAQQTAAAMQNAVATGQSTDLVGTETAVQKAELSFELGVSVRNKALDAYNSIINMQV